jgi:hypothetical protein
LAGGLVVSKAEAVERLADLSRPEPALLHSQRHVAGHLDEFPGAPFDACSGERVPAHVVQGRPA